jgi:protein involved in polysaccharide export with SLBB domain
VTANAPEASRHEDHGMRRRQLLRLSAGLVLAACSGGRPPPPQLPPPQISGKVSAGDKLEISVVGEKDLPSDYPIYSDGTIEFPYLPPIKVDGMEPQQIAGVLRQKLIEQKILTNPQVRVAVKQYASRKVNVIGQVQRPGPVVWFEGITLFDAITQAGGFTALADQNHVQLTRRLENGKLVRVEISVPAIADGQQNDVPLAPDDKIFVDAKVF